MRVSDQYVWNFAFTLLFLCFVIAGGIILDGEATLDIRNLSLMEGVVLALASMRLTRLFVYDRITAFFREQFWDVVEVRGRRALEKPAAGPRRTIADLLSCPWCFGIWSSAVVTFFYFISPIFWYPILFLALAGASTLLQLLANHIGWNAERAKRDIEGF
jgi:hypothetical protein